MAVRWGLAHRDLSEIQSIGPDEIALRKGYSYMTLVYQIDQHGKRLLWIGKERTIGTLQGFFDWFGPDKSARLRFVASDMWPSYVKVIAKRAPHALHILDRFHIMAHMGKAIDEIRLDDPGEPFPSGNLEMEQNRASALFPRQNEREGDPAYEPRGRHQPDRQYPNPERACRSFRARRK